ncbi:amino acid ABC transporter ATP-binding/permease protein [Corynebacterium anserum]|uniref:ATP-binding cassette domain-containing protein n=1 Tax=Corynebacterium anserum TaxID=2684406 RepID=A0A7G7YPZ7_9CORY|nr:ABC transporter ATP-binding protein [Corynebacterium anserum]QNH96567.1 ATP-binding cassette domain-containing protein [Corynebacterium anserum]
MTLGSFLRGFLPALKGSRGIFIATVVAGAVQLLSAAGATSVSGLIIGRAVTGQDPDLGRWGWLLAMCVLGAGLGTWWEMYVAHDLAYRVLAELRTALFRKLTRILPPRRRTGRSGDLVTTAVGDIEQLEWFFAHIAAQVLTVSIATLTGVIGLGVLVPWMIAVLLPAIVLILAVPWIVHRWAQRQAAQQREELGALGSDIVDVVDGMPDLIYANALDAALADVDEHTEALTRQRIRASIREGVEQALTTSIIALASVGSLLVVYLTHIDASLAPVIVGLSGATLAAPALLSTVLLQAGAIREAGERVLNIMNTPAETQEPSSEDAESLPSRSLPSVSAPCRSSSVGETRERMATSGLAALCLEHVHFSWDGVHPVLNDVCLEVAPGEILALTGASGRGKTTCIALAQRLYDPDDGVVRIFGVDVRRLPDVSLRQAVAVVPQEVQTFNGTIEDNLLLACPEATASEMRQALTAAGLEDFSLDREVGSRTQGLSGGQRTRLGVARALLVRPRVLLLDETSAHLDNATEELILSTVRRMASEGTAVMIVTHRPSTQAAADRVVEL